MLTMKTQYSLKNAESYFREHLGVGDYYMEGQSVSGQWFGQGARALGLSGVTTEKEFLNLCQNLHPQTDEQLTERMNTKRVTVDSEGNIHESTNRRVFYDFTFSPAKSVSIAALVGNDQRIIEAHDEAVMVALRELQTYAASRIRKQNQYAHRLTGNLVGAVFRHDTSRALDPHLHSHCILFNATRDSVEGSWKALEICEMLSAKKFAENVYYHELVKSLNQFGYRVQNNSRGDFEIQGVSKELVKKFSKRHDEIDRKTKELLEREPDKATRNLQEIRANIAHKERARKIKDVGLTRLQSLWQEQMSGSEIAAVQSLASNHPVPMVTGTAEQAVQWAEDHLFDRRSVVHEHELWRHALEHSRGQNVSLAEIQAVTQKRDYIRDQQYHGKLTTRDVLQREMNVVSLAQHRMQQYEPLASNYQTANTSLDDEQRKAVEHILSSNDFVTLFRGGAGTGKSFTLREVKAGLKAAGHTVQVLAPQRQQVADLERDGFIGAQTVSSMLARRVLTPGAIVLVDEAGQIGGEQMLRLLTLIKENDGRVILSGDTHQHEAVEASDALRAIEMYSGLGYAELTNIRRQNPDAARTKAERQWLEQYKLAVNEAQQGNLGASFDRLDKQGAVVACTLADQQQKLTEHFLELVKTKQSTVVVSQSWSEIHKVNEQVRLGLKAQKLIGDAETTLTALERLDVTDAQKRDKRFYQPDSVLVFNRPVVGFKLGSAGRLDGITDKHLLIEADNCIRPVPFKFLDRITVCQPKELALSTGDRLQLKANAQSQDGRRLANGELVTVKQIHADGRIALKDGRVLAKNYRQFVRGYAVTSYAAQGKTVDYVLFSDSAVAAATSEQQWYVTISRGRRGIKIFTADKIQLRQNVTRAGDRPLALDMTRESSVHRLATIWGRDVTYVLNIQHSQRKSAERQAEILRQRATDGQSQSEQQIESVKPAETVGQAIQKDQTVRRRMEIPPRQTNQPSRSMRI
jgi:conjugative relaxase-like TrwC/TraI family protein